MGTQRIIATFLKEKCKELGFKKDYDALADYIGMSGDTLKSYIYCKRSLKLDKLDLICEKLGVTIQEILSSEPKKKKEVAIDAASSLETVVESVGLKLDHTSYGNFTNEELDHIKWLDRELVALSSWDEAKHFMTDKSLRLWLRSLIEIKDSHMAMCRFILFFDKWNLESSIFPCEPNDGFPEELPGWIVDINPEFKHYNLIKGKKYRSALRALIAELDKGKDQSSDNLDKKLG